MTKTSADHGPIIPGVLAIAGRGARSEALARALARFGCEVIARVESSKALAAVRLGRPKLVVVDVGHAPGSRAALVDRLAAIEAHEPVPFVLVGDAARHADDLLAKRAMASVAVVPVPLRGVLFRPMVAHVQRQHAARARHAAATIDARPALGRFDADDFARKQLEMVIEGSRIGVWDWDAATGVVGCNERLLEMLGLEPHQCPRTYAGWRALVHPDDLGSSDTAMSTHFSGEKPFYQHVLRLRHREGHWVYVLSRGLVATRDEAGAPRRISGTATDISALKETEQLAREASEAKTRFLANMSHELRTPLNAILGLSEALRDGTFGTLSQTQTRSLHTIHESGRHLLALINDILDLSRIEAGKLPIDVHRTSISRLVEQVIAFVDPLATARRQRLAVELEPDLPEVFADHRRILQVLINLVGNAIQFSPAGADVILRGRRVVGEAAIEIEVCDAGPGMPESELERIFDPFVTLDMTKDRSGAGLGLALARRLVLLHGGTLRVESQLGHGTRFVMRLPLGGESRPEAERSPIEDGVPVPHPAAAAPLVLLVEDNEANIVTIQTYLEALGHPVRVVRDGLSAVEAAGATDVAVIIMDLQLPRLDGLEAVRRIRRAGRGTRKAIIAVTAYAMPGDDERCFAAGADAFLSKPVRMRELAHTVALHGRRPDAA